MKKTVLVCALCVCEVDKRCDGNDGRIKSSYKCMMTRAGLVGERSQVTIAVLCIWDFLRRLGLANSKELDELRRKHKVQHGSQPAGPSNGDNQAKKNRNLKGVNQGLHLARRKTSRKRTTTPGFQNFPGVCHPSVTLHLL
jgi:hypothetical protein